MMKQVTYYFESSDIDINTGVITTDIYSQGKVVKKVHIKTIPGVKFSLNSDNPDFIVSEIGEYFFENITIGTLTITNAGAIKNFNGTIDKFFVITITE